MKVAHQMLIVVLIPALAAVYLMASRLSEESEKQQQAETLQMLNRVAIAASQLVHELQKERGMSAGYLGSNGTNFRTQLPGQRDLADDQHAQLQALLERVEQERLGAVVNEKINQALRELAQRGQIRQRVDGLSISVADELKYYTGIIRNLIEIMIQAIHQAEDPDLIREMTAYVNLIEAKERAGIERATLANTFGGDQFGAGMYQRFINLLSGQTFYLYNFQQFVSTEMLQAFQQTLRGRPVDEVERLRQVAQDKATDGGFGVDAEYWFEMSTKRIGLIKSVQDQMATYMQSQTEQLIAEAERAYHTQLLVLIAALLGLSGLTFWTYRNADGLSNAVEQMSQQLGSAIAQLRQIAQHVQESSISVANAAHQQAATLEQVRTAMEDISQRAKNNAHQAEHSVQAAQEVAQTSATFSENLGQIAQLAHEERNAMELGSQALQEIAAVMTELQSGSSEIKDIISVINDISEQTKMLATNAAIEAARAGQYGKGFAVVANEVSKLAENSKDAAKEITQKIQESVHRIDHGNQVSSERLSTFEQVLQQFQHVSNLITEANTAAQQQETRVQGIGTAIHSIHLATGNQRESLESVAHALIEIDDTTQTNASNSEETAAVAQRLQEAVIDLQRQFEHLNHKFRLKPAPSA